MKELIKIEDQEINNELNQTVNARELHKFLEISSRYNDWIRNRISSYGFEENIDYVCLTKNLVTQTENGREGASTQKEHYITLDMAKELSMVERNTKGREARKYFIEIEKQYQKDIQDLVPKTLPDALEAYATEIRAHNRTKALLEDANKCIEEATPKVKYCDIVLACPDLLSVRQIAQDYGLSTQKLNNILRDKKIQYKNKQSQWVLYVQYGAQGYAQSTTHVYRDSNDIQHVNLLLKWTQKGRLFIYDLLKEEGILPICERDDM